MTMTIEELLEVKEMVGEKSEIFKNILSRVKKEQPELFADYQAQLGNK